MSYFCDWCGETIEDDLVTLSAAGRFEDGSVIANPLGHFHAGQSYSTGSCLRQMQRMLNGEELSAPNAGYVWRLVPAVEYARHDQREGTAPVLGITPLADLALEKETYMALTRDGVYTVEHAVDMRRRSQVPGHGVGIKRLERLDRALVERGLLGGSETVA